MDNADAWRATIPIRSHDFPSNGSNQNVFQQMISSLKRFWMNIYRQYILQTFTNTYFENENST